MNKNVELSPLTSTTWVSADWRYVVEMAPTYSEPYAVTDKGRLVGTFASFEDAAAWLSRFDAGEVRAQS